MSRLDEVIAWFVSFDDIELEPSWVCSVRIRARATTPPDSGSSWPLRIGPLFAQDGAVDPAVAARVDQLEAAGRKIMIVTRVRSDGGSVIVLIADLPLGCGR